MFGTGEDVETGWLRNWLGAAANSAKEGHYGDGSITQHYHPILPPFLWVVCFVFGLITQVSPASVSRCPYSEHREPGRWDSALRGREPWHSALAFSPLRHDKSFCFSFLRQDLTAQPRLPLSLKSSCLSHSVAGITGKATTPGWSLSQCQSWSPNAIRGYL